MQAKRSVRVKDNGQVTAMAHGTHLAALDGPNLAPIDTNDSIFHVPLPLENETSQVTEEELKSDRPHRTNELFNKVS